MAKTGLAFLAAAKVASYTEGTSITYSAGAKLAAMIAASVERTRSEASLYADNVRLEYDNTMTGATVSIEVDDLELADFKTLFGWDAVTTGETTQVTTYYETDGLSDKVGLGYVTERRRTVGGTTSSKYQGVWWYMGRCAIDSEEDKTRGETTEFGTQKFVFTADAVSLRSGAHDFREVQEFATEAAAIAWVKEKAGITA